ncbi:hypothetical protein [Bradyrhizobium sp. Cp5.3]|uniref:hypothetical protein n=1 Tax=Bradyrhizobium sp. Cp5.3 TaxID=443598 RepID=UPI0012ECA942|nr:hypothetical protein [Bradyrhizobium sp. Cp5.3]
MGLGASCCAKVQGEFRVFKLVKQLGSDGAEGRVFHGQSGSLNCAIKVYSQEHRRQGSDEKLLRKISLLIAAGTPFASARAPLFAWPQATIHKGTTPADLTAKQFVGFMMPMGDGLVSLAEIAERAKKFNKPSLTQRHMIGYLVARGFAMIHLGSQITDAGGTTRVSFAVGDVNDSNIAVTNDYVPFFLDCDSYIIRTRADIFDHAYGRPEYASPEYLTAKAIGERMVRAASDDNFGLAVLIFRLLNDWQRPYIYRGAKRLSAEALILERRFPYSSSGSEVIPDAKATLEAYRTEIDPRLKLLFKRAFLKGGARPTAAEWATSLGESVVARKDFVQAPKSPAAPQTAPQVSPPPTPIPIQQPTSSGRSAIMAAVFAVLVIIVWFLRH